MSGLGCLLPFSGKLVVDFLIQKKGFESLETILKSLGMGAHFHFFKDFFSSPLNVILMILLIGLTTMVLGFCQSLLAFRLEQKFSIRLQMALFDRVLRFPFSFFNKRTSSYLSTRILSDVDTVGFIIYSSASTTFSQIFRVIWGMIFIVTVSSFLSTIFLLGLPIYIVVNVFFAGKIRRITREERESEARVGERTQETFAAVELIKSLNAYKGRLGVLERGLKMNFFLKERDLLLNLISHYAERIVQACFAMVILGFGIHEVSRGNLTLGEFITFFSFLGILGSAVNALLEANIALQPWLVSVERLGKLLKKGVEIKKTNWKFHDFPGPKQDFNEIVFSDVSFSYRDSEPVLSNLSFRVKKGEITLLQGPSGIGKTSIAKLLLKFYKAKSGSITLDGQDLWALETFKFRQNIGYVSQDIFMFRETIAGNLRVAKPDASESDLISACKAAQIHDEITRFSQGYETVIGERGAGLSLGQRQRISIARAILKKPSIFIFDEPTSALDTQTAKKILSSIKEIFQSGIAIVISHKPDLSDFASQVIDLNRR